MQLRVNSHEMKKEYIVIEEVKDESEFRASTKNIDLALIIGLIIGILGFIVLVFVVAYFLMKQKKKRSH